MHHIFNLSILHCYVAESFDNLKCNLHIDALSLVNLNVKSAELHAILVESTCRNLRLIEMKQENQFEDTKLFTKVPKVMHFKPQGCGHLFTVVYPGNFTNDNTSKISYLDYICLLLIMISFIIIEFCIICNILYHHCIINSTKHNHI